LVNNLDHKIIGLLENLLPSVDPFENLFSLCSAGCGWGLVLVLVYCDRKLLLADWY